MARRSRLACVSFATVVSFVCAAGAQQRPVFRTGVDLVNVGVTVSFGWIDAISFFFVNENEPALILRNTGTFVSGKSPES